MRLLLLLGVLGVAGCDCSGDGSSPCTTCPPLGGSWTFQYDLGTSSGCEHTAFGALPGAMVIDQQESVLHANVDATPVSGSLFDTYAFRLTGSDPAADGGFDRIVQLKGYYVPATAGDGGRERIDDGLFSRSLESCDEETPFKAFR
jgi:hypothetical protein